MSSFLGCLCVIGLHVQYLGVQPDGFAHVSELQLTFCAAEIALVDEFVNMPCKWSGFFFFFFLAEL